VFFGLRGLGLKPTLALKSTGAAAAVTWATLPPREAARARRLSGKDDGAQPLWNDIPDRRLGNFERELESLKKRRRKKDAAGAGCLSPAGPTRHDPG